MVRMRVAYENPFRADLRLVRVEPEIEPGQKNAALMKFKLEHPENWVEVGRVSTA